MNVECRMSKEGILSILKTAERSLPSLRAVSSTSRKPACKPMKPMGWKRARSLRLGECDGRYQGDQPSAIKNICRGYNFLKSGLGQGFPVKVP